MISRRPKMRASTETDPGPRAIIANNTAAARAIVVLDSNRAGVHTGSSESPTPIASAPANTPAIGVRKPTSMRTPAASAVRPTSHAAGARSGCRT